MTEHGMQLWVGPEVPEDYWRFFQADAASELKRKHPDVQSVDFHWVTVVEGSIEARFHPELVGWHVLTATGIAP